MGYYNYCDRCQRQFNSRHALKQHEADSPFHYICDECGIDFDSWTGRKEHWVQSPYHHYCQHCSEHFPDDDELESHYEDNHPYCGRCRRIFKSNFGLREHYRQSEVHHYCVSCDRDFQSESNLQSANVACPFRGCDLAFVSRSAMLLHLESGGCQSGVDRKTINQYVRKYDRNNVITTPSRLLTNGDDDISYSAGPASWNGIEYECYLCNNGYRSLAALNQHLASPRHQQKIYFCPLESCRTRFTTLSALCQHIESERCGISRFKVVQNTLDGLVGRMGRITV
ncbi:hypothetical protein BDZ94DRAFT_1278770 [Collybia nuda]|uniref:C2H2-type domain-containing protein n=1 Tax=Collybia nuda TaxID=64659 RepID=A0A9P6CR12_9AGAR|nr:hypothetical protein BDZ94DRAFT_1278770 [Collybia nuda]